MLEGLLVDLVPFDARFREREVVWRNNEAAFWGSGGDRAIESRRFVEELLRGRAERSAQNPQRGVWFGIQTKDGVPIGGIGPMWFSNVHRWAMLGAKIGEPDYWSGGYGTDALLLVLGYCFDWLDLHRAWLITTSMNARVQRQMEKVGFQFEARMRQSAYADGVWHDELHYGMHHTAWQGRAALVDALKLRERAASLYGI